MLAALTKSLARSGPWRVSWTGAGSEGGGVGTDPGAAVSEAGERSRVGGGTCGSGPAGAVSGTGEIRRGTRGTDPSGAVASVRFWSVSRGAIGTDPSGAVASKVGFNPGDELAGLIHLGLSICQSRGSRIGSGSCFPPVGCPSRLSIAVRERTPCYLKRDHFSQVISELARGRGRTKGVRTGFG